MKKTKVSNSRFFFFVLTVLCVGLSVLTSHFFANVISTSSFSATSYNASSPGYCLYALSCKSFAVKAQAVELSSSLKSKNCGSYIYNFAGKFYVVCSIYEHENDAKSVQENISESFPSSEILPLNIDSANFANATNADLKKSFLNAISKLKQTYLDLYDISVSIDTSVYSETKAVIECSKIYDELSSFIETIPTGSNAFEGAYSVLIRTKLKKINSLLKELTEFSSSENYTLSSKIKDVYIEIVFENINLIDLINEK